MVTMSYHGRGPLGKSTTARARAVTVLDPVTSRNPSTTIDTVTVASDVPATHTQSLKIASFRSAYAAATSVGSTPDGSASS